MSRQRTPGEWGVAAAMLSSFFLFSQGQKIALTVKPQQPFVGGSVVLIPEGKPDFIQCTWYRGTAAEAYVIFTYVAAFQPPEQQNGSLFTGRETVAPDCSLNISNLKRKDTNTYRVSKTVVGGPEVGSAYIKVRRAPVGKGVLTPGLTVVVLAGAVLIRILF